MRNRSLVIAFAAFASLAACDQADSTPAPPPSPSTPTAPAATEPTAQAPVTFVSQDATLDARETKLVKLKLPGMV